MGTESLAGSRRCQFSKIWLSHTVVCFLHFPTDRSSPEKSSPSLQPPSEVQSQFLSISLLVCCTLAPPLVSGTCPVFRCVPQCLSHRAQHSTRLCMEAHLSQRAEVGLCGQGVRWAESQCRSPPAGLLAECLLSAG